MGRAGALPGAATLDCVEDREVGVADADRECSVRLNERLRQAFIEGASRARADALDAG